MEMTKERLLEYGKSLSKKDKKKLINHWLSCPENGYLGSSFGKPNTLDKSILRKKCRTDLPFLSTKEIEDIITNIIVVEPKVK